MDEFTSPNAVLPGAAEQCRLLPAFPHHHHLGLGSPPPWIVDGGASPWGGDGGEHGEEEKMDMLWEDFNEELTRMPPVCPLSPLHKGEMMTMTMMKEAWLGCGGGGNVSGGLVVARAETDQKRNAGSVVRRRRWSLLLMLRLLKKLFLVKKSRSPRTAPL